MTLNRIAAHLFPEFLNRLLCESLELVESVKPLIKRIGKYAINIYPIKGSQFLYKVTQDFPKDLLP